MNTSDWIQVIILVVYAFGVIASINYSRKSIKVSSDSSKNSLDLTKESLDLTKKQIWSQMFVECTRRYNEIILHMPNVSYGRQDDLEAERCMRLFINLYVEEHYLREKEMIDPEVWEMWLDKMRITMQDPFYISVYNKVIGDFNFAEWSSFRHDVIDWKDNAHK